MSLRTWAQNWKTNLRLWRRGGDVFGPSPEADRFIAKLSDGAHWHDRHADINNDPPCDDPDCIMSDWGNW